ncbi:MAG: transketolase C-terminal domain-containing protein [Eubacteriales bacterium]|nr:transketolase C-terminal domain-containing protein [Eubacteriales bacterium]
MGKAIRDVYGEALKKYGAVNENIVVLDADVSGSTKSAVFGKEYPDRFYNCGISEYAMMGMAAGMAKNGKIPFVNTFAVFLTTLGSLAARAALSYSGLNVKMMGGYGGLSDAYDGATHHALEDIAMMRTLPDMTVMVASDAAITDWMVKTAAEVDGPMYIRLSRDAAPDCHPGDAVFELGKGMVVREGTDATVIACGLLVSTAVKAAEMLAAEGISVRVVDMYCIKPLDEELIRTCAEETGAIVTAEEHSVIGGLGGAVSEALARAGAGVPVEMVGTKDCHAESGAYAALLKKYGLDADAVASAVRKAVSRKQD